MSSKTNALNCNYAGSGGFALNGWDDVVHMEGESYGFVDGHAKTYDFKPSLDLWLSTGGTRWRTGPFTDGELAYTYPPGLTDTPGAAQ